MTESYASGAGPVLPIPRSQGLSLEGLFYADALWELMWIEDRSWKKDLQQKPRWTGTLPQRQLVRDSNQDETVLMYNTQAPRYPSSESDTQTCTASLPFSNTRKFFLIFPPFSPQHFTSAMSITTITPGRTLILLGNLAYALGAFIADYNETHVKNPRWPPHAKFHNGQTMTLGILLASASLFFLYRPAVSIARKRENVLYAAVVGSFYCAAGLSAILYPGTAWQESVLPRLCGWEQMLNCTVRSSRGTGNRDLPSVGFVWQC